MDFGIFDFNKNLDSQRELFLDAFPETKDSSIHSIEHYYWKFQTFPSKVKSYEYVVCENQKIIGYYAAIPYKYKFGNKVKICGMVCDVMTHSTMRGKGVFTKMGSFSLSKLKLAGIDFTSGYPIRPEVIPGHLKVGWEIAFELPVYIQFISLKTVLKHYGYLKYFHPIFSFFSLVYNSIFRSFNSQSNDYSCEILDLEAILKNNFEYDVFLKTWSDEINYTLIKDISFLSWRLGAPNSDYKILVLRYKTKLVGLSIIRKTEIKQIPTIAILDLMILRENYKASNVILNMIYDYAIKISVESIALMISKDWASNYGILKCGFIRTPFVFKLILNLLNHELKKEDMHNSKNWHLMWIDSDDL